MHPPQHLGLLTAQDQVPSNNGFLVPQTGTARTTGTQSWHGRRCKEGPYQDRPPLCPFRL